MSTIHLILVGTIVDAIAVGVVMGMLLTRHIETRVQRRYYRRKLYE